MKAFSIIKELDIGIDIQDIAYFFSEGEKLCFLDSSLTPNKYSNHSYLSWDPVSRLSSRGYENTVINYRKGINVKVFKHPVIFLKDYLARSTFKKKPGPSSGYECFYIGNKNSRKEFEKNRPVFKGGFIGYLSYDLKDFIEELPVTVEDDINMPLIEFYYYDWAISFSHLNNRYYFIKNFFYLGKDSIVENKYLDLILEEDAFIKGVGYKKAVKIAGERIEEDIKRRSEEIKDRLFSICGKDKIPVPIKKQIADKYLKRRIQGIRLKSNFKKEDYLKAVNKAKQYIHQGDIYQINMTQRFSLNKKIEPADLYYILREKNPAPFSAFMDFGEIKIGSSSPERFLLLEGGIIQTRPIKGTRPRGKNAEQDERFRKELESSEKDRAELNMIVDLERNDLGKFCDYGTVEVTEHAVIEKYEKVLHSVSTVIGKVREGYDISDIIKATFPGGSITGAPKIRAMQIIDELETKARNVYTGSIGYIGIDNSMDINIVIRTFIIKGNDLYYNVGGGIVEDSEAIKEYEETLDKGLALKNSLEFFDYDNLDDASK